MQTTPPFKIEMFSVRFLSQCVFSSSSKLSSGAVGRKVGPARLGVRIPAATALSRKKQVVTAPLVSPRQ